MEVKLCDNDEIRREYTAPDTTKQGGVTEKCDLAYDQSWTSHSHRNSASSPKMYSAVISSKGPSSCPPNAEEFAAPEGAACVVRAISAGVFEPRRLCS